MKSLTCTKLRFLNFEAALAVSPSVIIEIFLDFLSLIKTQPNLFDAIFR